MNLPLLLVLLLLATAIAMFVVNRPRMDAVALIVMTMLPFVGPLTGTDVVSMNEALSGFADANIVLIAALFVIGDGLVRTGVARRLGDWLTATAGSSETRLLVLLMVVVCGLGATMSSTAVTAIFIPVVLRIARTTKTAPSRLLMPLSMAALISGMTTLVATAPNLVVNSELVRGGSKGFGFFDFTPFGIPVLILGIVYMLFARHWLPKGESDELANDQPSLADWVNEYQLKEREQRVRIAYHSPLIGKRLDELSMRDHFGANIVAIQRHHQLLQPTGATQLHAGDILLVDLFTHEANAESLRTEYALEALPLTGAYFNDQSQEIGMVEVMLPAASGLIGKTIANAKFRTRCGLTVIGLRRGKTAIDRGLQNETLQLGDTLLLIGPWKAIRNIQTGNHDLVVLSLPSDLADVLPVAGKIPHAVAILLGVVVLMVSGLVPNVQAALLGCLMMLATGCVSLESSYRSIDWKTIVLIVGMLPFSTALQRTGGVDLASDGLMVITSGMGTYGVLAAIFAITALLGMFISNTATAVLMAPVAMAVADQLGNSRAPFAMIVALAASTAFMTPVSSPVNTLVVTPGNYSFADFVKIGVPFSIVVMIVCVFLVPLLLPM